MEIDLGSNKITIKINAKEYMIDEPTLKDVKRLQELGDDAEAMPKFFNKLGLPKEVIEQLGIYQIKKLTQGLLTPLNEKK